MTAQDHSRTIKLTMAIFVLQPLVMGGWFALIPHVQQSLGLSKSELALALLGMPAALILALQFASRVVVAVGARRVFLVAFPIQGIVVLLPLWASGQISLFFMLMALGAGIGFLQVCLNSYAGRLEIETGRLIMNRCHGFWSLGLMLGSLAVTAVVSSTGPILALVSVSVVSVVGGIWASAWLPGLVASAGASPAPPRRKWREVPVGVLIISALLLPVTMTEGAMSDWAAIYLAERLPAGATHAGLAVAIYAGSVTCGRFLGDALKLRFGAVMLARGTIILAITGLAVLAAPLPLGFAYAGFVLIGLGVSVAFPLGVSATAAQGQTYATANIAIMSTFAIMGFLVGPPLIGFLADWTSLKVGLAALIPALVFSVALSGHLAQK